MDDETITTCPKCEGKGQMRYTRKGGWIIETCTACRGRGVLDAATAAVVRGLMEIGARAGRKES